MVQRYKKLGDQLGKRIPDPGAHLPHAVVGLLRKHRTKRSALAGVSQLKGGSKVKPLKEYDPFPTEYLPGSY